MIRVNFVTVFAKSQNDDLHFPHLVKNLRARSDNPTSFSYHLCWRGCCRLPAARTPPSRTATGLGYRRELPACHRDIQPCASGHFDMLAPPQIGCGPPVGRRTLDGCSSDCAELVVVTIGGIAKNIQGAGSSPAVEMWPKLCIKEELLAIRSLHPNEWNERRGQCTCGIIETVLLFISDWYHWNKMVHFNLSVFDQIISCNIKTY